MLPLESNPGGTANERNHSCFWSNCFRKTLYNEDTHASGIAKLAISKGFDHMTERQHGVLERARS